MNLLLLLSAIFSALTGVGVGVRRPEVAQSVAAQAAVAQPARSATVILAQRPVAALPALIASVAFAVSIVPVSLGTTNLWASRRRE